MAAIARTNAPDQYDNAFNMTGLMQRPARAAPTRAIAEFMADAALKNAIANHGWKAAGPISMKCKDDTLTTTCTARRRACD